LRHVGFELPNAAGDEMKDPQKDVPYTVIRAAIGTFVLYGAPILAILLVLPAAQITSLGGFMLLGVLFYWAGRPTRMQQVDVPLVPPDAPVAPVGN
jgi:amino acid transporter